MKQQTNQEPLLQIRRQPEHIDTDDLIVEIIAEAIRNMRRPQKPRN